MTKLHPLMRIHIFLTSFFVKKFQPLATRVGHAARVNLPHLVIALVLALCLPATNISFAEQPLRVAAASSLRQVLPAIIAAQPSSLGRVVVTYGASGTLAQQILHGAPFDIFLSADVATPDLLAKQLPTAGPVQIYARGQLALIGRGWDSMPQAPTASGSAQTNAVLPQQVLKDWLAKEGQRTANSGRKAGLSKLAIANPKHAPYGMQAKAYLEGVGLWQAVQPHLVTGENISQTVQFVVTGNADWALGAMSLVAGQHNNPSLNKLKVLPIQADFLPPLAHAYVVLSNAEKAENWMQYLMSSPVSSLWKTYGFLPTNLQDK